MSGPLGNGPGSHEMATRLESGAAARSDCGAELGLPFSRVEITTDGAEYTGSPGPPRPDRKIATRNCQKKGTYNKIVLRPL